MTEFKKFVCSDLYKAIKAGVGLPPTNKLPNDNFSMIKALRMREHGLASPGLGSFSLYQRRGIVNLYTPNSKESRIMSLNSKVVICKFSKAGDRLMTVCQDGIIQFYNASNGMYQLMNRIKTRDISWIQVDADFSPCGQFYAYSSWHKELILLPVNGSTNDKVRIHLDSNYVQFAIFSLRYSPCGSMIIAGSNRSSIYTADIERQTSLKIRLNRYAPVDINTITYASDTDTNVILCGCDDASIRLFDLRCRQNDILNTQSVFCGHCDSITYLDPRNDGNHILSNSTDQTIKIWDLRKPSPINIIQNFESPDWDYRWDTLPQTFYNANKKLKYDTCLMTYRGHCVRRALLRAKFSPAQQTGQRYIYTGCATGRLIIYDILTGKIKETIEGHTNVISDLDWHPQRSEILTGSWDSYVHLNTYKPNAISTQSETRIVKKKSTSSEHQAPLRRSERIRLRHKKPEPNHRRKLQQDKDGLTFNI